MRTLVIVTLAFVLINGVVSAGTETIEQCPAEARLDSLDENLRLFFTMPSQTESPSLDLWYADSTGVYPTSHAFTEKDWLILSPDGAYIFVGRTQFMGSAVAEPYGAPRSQYGAIRLYDVLIIETDTFTIRQLSLPAWFYETRFIQYPTVWIDNQTLSLVTIWEGVQTVELNIDTEAVVVQDWSATNAFLPNPSGRVFPSPNGDYLFYTTDVVALQNTYSPFPDRSWRIIDRGGNILVDYIMGTVGDSAVWLPDSSGVLLNNQQGDLLQVGLDGEVITLHEYEGLGVLTGGLPDITGTRIAFDRSIIGTPNFGTIAILDTSTDQVIDYCQTVLFMKLGYWSSDGRFLASIMLNSDSTQLSILDTTAQTQIEFIPYQPVNGSISYDFVRILGWQYINQAL